MSEEQLGLDLGVAEAQKKRDVWAKRVEEYKKFAEKWESQGGKVVDRYRDEKGANEEGNRTMRLNIFWANVQTLGPAIYAKPPKPEVTRRYFDKDPTGRLASAVLERALMYEMDITGFHEEVLRARDDYLLPGRGTLWQRYEPIIEKTPIDTGGDELGTPQPGQEVLGGNGGPPMNEEVIGENAPTDYVHWKDFMHGIAQNWKQVPWVGRWVLMDKSAVAARWPDQPELLQQMSFVHKQEKDDNKQKTASSIGNLAKVGEFWDKTTYKAIWYSPDLKDRLIEEMDDPLKLNDFFPTPEPLYATMTTDRLIPRPDYILYQDQAVEVDILTQRIHLLVKALAVRGVYDASNTRLADLLNERPENFMLPVDNWAAFAEKGGLQGQMSFVPIDQIVKTLKELMGARQVAKNDIYEVTGIADIVRGVSAASETATAQQLKGQFANLRLNARRSAVASFLEAALRIKAEVMSEHFAPDTLRKISGFDQMTEVQQAKEKGEDVEQLWGKTYEMLKSDPLRLTHLKVSIDSMVDADIQQEQQSRVQFLQAVGTFLKEALQAAQMVPSIAPLLGQMISWGVRGFKIGREMESSIDAALEKLEQLAAQPQQPKPDPEQQKMEMEQKRLEQELQQNQQRFQQEQQMEQQRLAADEQRAQQEHELRMKELEFENTFKIRELELKYMAQQKDFQMKEQAAAHDQNLKERSHAADVELKKEASNEQQG